MQSGQADAAQAELDALPANLAEDAKAKRLRNQLEFSRVLENAPDMPALRARLATDPNDHAARDLLGVRLLLGGDPAAGLDQFLHILRSGVRWRVFTRPARCISHRVRNRCHGIPTTWHKESRSVPP
jgi:putative thioredoxin